MAKMLLLVLSVNRILQSYTCGVKSSNTGHLQTVEPALKKYSLKAGTKLFRHKPVKYKSNGCIN